MMKQGHDLQASYEFDKVLSEHTNMMDCRKTKKPYSEEKMRELVDNEYNVLKLLIGVAEKGLAADHQNIILSIFSMLSMFTVSLYYFDEQYYFNNRSALGDKDVWHSSHQNWMSVYDKLSSPWFIEMLQDYAMFETNLNTLGIDVYYMALVEQIRDLREKVEDNQKLIIALGDIELLHSLHDAINIKYISAELEKELPEYTFMGRVVENQMDFSYFQATRETLKESGLKVQVVFIHSTCKFEVWISGYNRKIQSRYYKMLCNSECLFEVCSDPERNDFILKAPVEKEITTDTPEAIIAEIKGKVTELETYIQKSAKA